MEDSGKQESHQSKDNESNNCNTMSSNKQLKLDEIDFNVEITKEEFINNWGQPDSTVGFGLEYLVYRLEDGRYLGLRFASQKPHPLLIAIITDDKTKEEGQIIFDGTDKTKLR